MHWTIKVNKGKQLEWVKKDLWFLCTALFLKYTWPLYEIVLNSNKQFSSYALDKKKAMEK
jgi:hypothetical protein